MRSPPATIATTIARASPDRAGELDAVAAQLARDDVAGGILAALRHEPGLGAEGGRPRGDVRGLAAGARVRACRAIVVGDERLLEPDDHVQEQVAERRDPHA